MAILYLKSQEHLKDLKKGAQIRTSEGVKTVHCFSEDRDRIYLAGREKGQAVERAYDLTGSVIECGKLIFRSYRSAKIIGGGPEKLLRDAA